ncbi:hypothetical protein HMPREF1246_0921 [Acidaminococcus sp. BV3L6]|nr:hypothetical protein HMPREF1246_0921 [Acidaminococcus sp. BV3L6]
MRLHILHIPLLRIEKRMIKDVTIISSIISFSFTETKGR